MALGTTKRGLLKAAGWPFLVNSFFQPASYISEILSSVVYTTLVSKYTASLHNTIPAVCVTITRTIRRPMLTREYRSWMGRY